MRVTPVTRRVAVHTLGCKVNQYDSEAMLTLFRRRGYETVAFGDAADVYVINTCAVTEEGDRKSRQLIRRARRRNPQAVVVVAGCYPQTAPGEVAGIPGVDVVLGNQDRVRVVELAEEAGRSRQPIQQVGNIFRITEFEEMGIEDYEGRTRAPVKIQEGCHEFCSFCIIPYARGRPRSRRPEEVRAEVERLAASGVREVVLTGIHLGAYGQGRGPGLAGVLRHIHPVEGIERIRLSSLEPMDAGQGVIEAMAALPKVCRHLHLPVQSGSDPVLARMRRRYTAHQFRGLADLAREKLPGVALTTDVMAGFPGESEEDHLATLALIEEVGFTRLHVFPFSARPGTPAARFPDQVPAAVRERRALELAELGARLALAHHRGLVGRRVEVLVEYPLEDGWREGYTGDYVRVRFPDAAGVRPRTFAWVEVEEADAEGVRGRLAAGLLSAGRERATGSRIIL